MTVLKSDSFTGTNGAAWNSSIWTTTGIDTGSTLDIQSNQGRMASGTTPYMSAAAALAPGVQDYEVSYRFAIPSNAEWYHFLHLRGDALANPGPRGLPNSYEIRFSYYAPNNSLALNLYELDGAGTKTYRFGNDYLGGLVPSGTFVRVKVQIRGSIPSLVLRVRFWLDGTTEPTTWVDLASSATANRSGANLALIFQGGADTTTDTLLVDDFVLDNMIVAGTVASTEAPDVLAGAGAVALGSTPGAMALTEAPDTLAAAGFTGTPATSSTVQNPTHIYTRPGVYTVTETVTNAQGSTRATRVVTVLAPVVVPPPTPPATTPPTRTVFLLANLMTGQVVDELECSSFRYDDVLNRPGTWSATIPLRSSKAQRGDFLEGARSVWVVRGSQVLFGGVLWACTVDVDENGGDVATLTGDGFMSLYRGGRRTVRSRAGMTRATGATANDVTWPATTELFAVAEDVFAHAANVGGSGDFGFTIDRKGPATLGYSGVQLGGALTFTADQRKGIAEILEELTSREPGIDFGFRYGFTTPAATPAILKPTLELNYPFRGLQTAYVLEAGKNIAAINYVSDAGKMANYVDGFGAGTGPTMVRSTVEDTTRRAPAGPYPLLETAVTNKAAMSVNYLRGALVQELATIGTPLETVALTLNETAEVPLGAFGAGDFVTVHAVDGFLSVTGSWRCTGLSVAFDENGATAIKGTFAAARHFGG